VPGGSFLPNLDTGSMPPPASLPSTSPPSDPTAAPGGLARSNYESPAAAPGSAPPLETPPSTAPPAAAVPPPAATSPALTAYSLKRDWQEAERLVAEGKCRDALAKLSPYHGHPDLPPDQRPHLAAWLDALAAKVIYSREHFLAAPYRVRKGETLFDVSNNPAVNVPWPLLLSINRGAVNDPMIVVPGTELKVVPGPFRADINLTTSELTLFLGDLYAGRFPLALGDQPPQPGSYQVRDKRNDRTYYGLDGRVIPANDPANPYGGYWLDLSGEVSIHGSPLTPTSRTLGCISLSPQDAKDVYSILSLNSDVTIRR
jgi:lipoprotein-anchoring transpeptidase ErfK/SrfK